MNKLILTALSTLTACAAQPVGVSPLPAAEVTTPMVAASSDFAVKALSGQPNFTGSTPGSNRTDNQSASVRGFEDFATYEIRVTANQPMTIWMEKIKNGIGKESNLLSSGTTKTFVYNSADFNFDTLSFKNAASAKATSYSVLVVMTVAPPRIVAPNFNSAAYRQPTNPFSSGQCTWYVMGRVNETTGRTLSFSKSSGRDAKNWYDMVTGLNKGSTPRSGAIAVWGGGPFGHVAYVESVNGDQVTFSQANIGLKGEYDGRTTISSSRMNGYVGSKYYLIGYIYTK